MAPDDSTGTGTGAPIHSRHGSAPPSRPSSPSQPPPSQQLQPLFVSQAVFDQLSHGKEATPKFPPIVQGFVASAFTFREYAFCCFPRVSARDVGFQFAASVVCRFLPCPGGGHGGSRDLAGQWPSPFRWDNGSCLRGTGAEALVLAVWWDNGSHHL